MDLRQIRESKHLKKKEAASYLGVDIKTYNKYENGAEEVNPDKKEKFCKSLLEYGEEKKRISNSTDSFEDVILGDYYYVDKTLFLKEIIEIGEQSIMFTRPRRFGKTMNMDMIRHFFDIHGNSSLFSGLQIEKDRGFCEKFQNKYPIISLSFKDCYGPNVEDFYYEFSALASDFLARRNYLFKSRKLSAIDKERLTHYLDYTAKENELSDFLRFMAYILHKEFEQRVLIIIDEYDVPLEKASLGEYYDQAVNFMRTLFSKVSKTNPDLFMMIFTGCLRISKESIFTGLNNPKIYSVLDAPFANYFGFTHKEVEKMLAYYGLSNKFNEIQRYYDGYCFGGLKIYCPFDVACYVKDHLYEKNKTPEFYWINSSGNDIILRLLEKADYQTREEIEALIQGGTIDKKLDFSLTYRDLYSNKDNIFSVMVASGYLTVERRIDNSVCSLRIPNYEAKQVFINQIEYWLDHLVVYKRRNEAIYSMFLNGEVELINAYLANVLKYIIGIHDYSRNDDGKEAFYHRLLLGLLKAVNDDEEYLIQSNKEAGEGFSDIVINDPQHNVGAIIEIKYSKDEDLKSCCKECAAQIENRRYEDCFSPIYKIRKYAIAFFKKRCLVEEVE